MPNIGLGALLAEKYPEEAKRYLNAETTKYHKPYYSCPFSEPRKSIYKLNADQANAHPQLETTIRRLQDSPRHPEKPSIKMDIEPPKSLSLVPSPVGHEDVYRRKPGHSVAEHYKAELEYGLQKTGHVPQLGWNDTTGLPYKGVRVTSPGCKEALLGSNGRYLKWLQMNWRNIICLKYQYFSATNVEGAHVYVWIEFLTEAYKLYYQTGNVLSGLAIDQIAEVLQDWCNNRRKDGTIKPLSESWVKFVNACDSPAIFSMYQEPPESNNNQRQPTSAKATFNPLGLSDHPPPSYSIRAIDTARYQDKVCQPHVSKADHTVPGNGANLKAANTTSRAISIYTPPHMRRDVPDVDCKQLATLSSKGCLSAPEIPPSTESVSKSEMLTDLDLPKYASRCCKAAFFDGCKYAKAKINSQEDAWQENRTRLDLVVLDLKKELTVARTRLLGLEEEAKRETMTANNKATMDGNNAQDNPTRSDVIHPAVVAFWREHFGSKSLATVKEATALYKDPFEC